MYADDVGLLNFEACEIQQIMDVPDVFCTMFDMEVNLAPHKTCVVCFRPCHLKIPGRMFGILVEPVLSYASHILGPAMFAERLHSAPYGACVARKPRVCTPPFQGS